MRTAPRILVFLLVALIGSITNLHSMCTQSVMPIFQCGFVGWFAPPPLGSGAVSTVWWQLGYGNNLVNFGLVPSAANEGTGIAPAGVFSGNDGGLSSASMQLSQADLVLPQYAAQIPDGSLCANFEFSWAGFGVDGCADNPRTVQSVDNDNFLNPYFSSAYGPCPYDGCPYETTSYLIDYPMAVLAREDTNRFFALAFVASRTRNGDSTDFSEGMFDLSQVTNGNPNPVTGKLNVIPWQPVPRLRLDAYSRVPGDPTQTLRNVSLSWDSVRLVHDGSSRLNNRADFPVGGAGVGVIDQLAQGPLCRYQLQAAPIDGTPNPDPSTLAWSNVGSPIPCTTAPVVTANLVQPYGTALRIRTSLGKNARTTSTTLANCRTGSCGDLGFEATGCKADNCLQSPPLLILWPPNVSEQAVDTVAARNRNAVVVSFRTTSELTVTGIDILGKENAVLASLPCRQCTSGIGDRYEVLLTPGQLKGSRELRVRLNGPDVLSEPFPIQ